MRIDSEVETAHIIICRVQVGKPQMRVAECAINADWCMTCSNQPNLKLITGIHRERNSARRSSIYKQVDQR